MRIEAIELRRIKLPYRSPFETSGWREEANHSVIVTLHSEGAIGWGEAPVGAGPWYNEETQATAWVMMREILAPMLLGRDLSRPEEVDAIFAACAATAWRGPASNSQRGICLAAHAARA